MRFNIGFNDTSRANDALFSNRNGLFRHGSAPDKTFASDSHFTIDNSARGDVAVVAYNCIMFNE